MVLALGFLLAYDERYPGGRHEAVRDHHENGHAERVESGIDVLLVCGTFAKQAGEKKEERSELNSAAHQKSQRK